ncbi:MAG: ribosome silencing factor [Bacteroidia bacterium]|nr:ribosome silencing factor [Bacteroidia bacterium]MDW8159639.1 ribosome silencing factor [Bacteroidia bacterium]
MVHKTFQNSSWNPLVNTIIDGILEKKGFDIKVLDLRQIPNSITNFFIICSGSSDTQNSAIYDSVKKFTTERLNEKPWKTEGLRRAEWIIMDYVNVVVHIFLPRVREYYKLEELWGDAQITEIEEGKMRILT